MDKINLTNIEICTSKIFRLPTANSKVIKTDFGNIQNYDQHQEPWRVTTRILTGKISFQIMVESITFINTKCICF